MAIEINQFRYLEAGDRLIITHEGRQRVALVLGWVGPASKNKLEVRLHKHQGLGWVRKPITIVREDVVCVTRSGRLGVKLMGAA